MIQEVEQILETQDRQVSEELRFRPPKDSLIPPGHSTGTASPIRSVQGREQESRHPSETISTRGGGGQDGRNAFNHPIPQIRSLKRRNETQLLMQLNKLLEPKQRFRGKGE